MGTTIIGLVILVIFGIAFLIYTSTKKGSTKKRSSSNKDEEAKAEIKDSHKVRSRSKDVTEKDMFDFMEFDKIADNMIIQDKGKRYTMVIQCKGINYDLMSEVEQMAVEEGFITFLNTLRYPVQLYVQARSVDLKQNLNIYKKSVEDIQNTYDSLGDKYREISNNIDADYTDIHNMKLQLDKQAHILNYAQDITRYVEKISLNKSILQRKFYIVLSYNREEIAATTDFSEQEIYNICHRELYTRSNSLIGALVSCSVEGRVITSNELAELLYISYNRDDEKLLDIKTALESGFYRLYSTSKDVFEKKEEAMQREVEEEAKRRVQSAIDEVLKMQEKKTPDELVEEFEERADKEAINIIDKADMPKEGKGELKSIIIQNHVVASEERKVERKIKKLSSENKDKVDVPQEENMSDKVPEEQKKEDMEQYKEELENQQINSKPQNINSSSIKDDEELLFDDRLPENSSKTDNKDEDINI